ncbi:MAG: hypothetical protein NTZ48_04500 [Candidatus Omnitrophica bacterium]|nr:hypothetical protein [Candidatus Omnitrophota bacterium]
MLKSKGLILCLALGLCGILFWNISLAEAGGLPPKSVKLIALKYLLELSKANGIAGVIAHSDSPSDYDKYLSLDNLQLEAQFNQIAEAVTACFSIKRWTLEDILAATKEAVLKTEFSAYVGSAIDKWTAEYNKLPADKVGDIFEGNLGTVSTAKTRVVKTADVSGSYDPTSGMYRAVIGNVVTQLENKTQAAPALVDALVVGQFAAQLHRGVHLLAAHLTDDTGQVKLNCFPGKIYGQGY